MGHKMVIDTQKSHGLLLSFSTAPSPEIAEIKSMNGDDHQSRDDGDYGGGGCGDCGGADHGDGGDGGGAMMDPSAVATPATNPTAVPSSAFVGVSTKTLCGVLRTSARRAS
mmetsp:Transcript_55457/g.102593  ORF Transcript_55457/g.102593 Transcript_55457/m.102593 type:complete len:111 (+) Transcript_55457:175-507(+)